MLVLVSMVTNIYTYFKLKTPIKLERSDKQCLDVYVN